MLRRVLPLAVLSATAVLVPSTASATPKPAPVENYQGSSYYASVEDVILSDGRHASVSIGEGRGTSQRQGWGSLYLEVRSTDACLRARTCQAGWAAVSVPLTGDQVVFDRSLRTASVQDLAVELPDTMSGPAPGDYVGGYPPSNDSGYEPGYDPGYDWGYDPGSDWGYEPGYDPGYDVPGDAGSALPTYSSASAYATPQPSRTMILTVVFTGTGPLERSAGHTTVCGDGSRICQAIRVEAARDAAVRLSLDGDNGESAGGRLIYGHSVDAAAPKFTYEGN